MSNNSTAPICWQPDWFFALGERINFAQLFVILPIYATIGLFGHIICVGAFFKQAKNEKAYIYQILLEVTGCLENISFTLFLLSFLGGGEFGDGYEWYQKSYFLMWYAAHLAIPLLHSFSVSCLMLNVSMAADRVFALTKPFAYKSINRKKHLAVALALSLVIGFGSTLFNSCLFEVQNGENQYMLGIDMDFIQSLTSTILSNFCNFTRMVGLLALVTCNISILRQFGKHVAQIAKLTIVQLSTTDKRREAAEKSLLALTIVQSFFMAVTMFSYVLFYTAAYAIPLFAVCDQTVYAPLLNSVLMLCDLGKTGVIVALNRKAREMLKIFCFAKNRKKSKVGVTSTTAATGNGRHTAQGTLFNDSKL